MDCALDISEMKFLPGVKESKRTDRIRYQDIQGKISKDIQGLQHE